VFLFIAPPSAACVAWFNIQHRQLTLVSEAYWAVAGFFYLLVFRAARSFLILILIFTTSSHALMTRSSFTGIWLQFVRGAKFNIVWWACTFPLTAYAVATTVYSFAIDSWFTRSLNFFTVIVSTTSLIVVAGRTVWYMWRHGCAGILPPPMTMPEDPLAVPSSRAPAALQMTDLQHGISASEA
jgi:tellurite resistance protein TehA-like permease